MATEEHAIVVEHAIGHSFQSKRSLLLQALTAAGAEEDNWDGNRKLAQLGTALTEFLLVYLGYEAQVSRGELLIKSPEGVTDVMGGCTTNFKCRLSNINQRAVVAERTGIDKCIKYSEKQGGRSSTVLGKAVNAIIGAVFLDCRRDLTVTLGVMLRLGSVLAILRPIAC
jgi:dsRNA-specific ribonuclease